MQVRGRRLLARFAGLACMVACTGGLAQAPQSLPQSKEGIHVARDFRFKSGEVLAELKLHYITFGQPVRDAGGRVTNAVLLLHGTGGSAQSLLRPTFANELFGPGQLLDTTRYFLILPSGIGHGKSSKPSDGLRMKFPAYDYEDMIVAHKRLLEDGLGVNHLRLILGTSMGCMHAWMWGEAWPDFMDALMPLACLPVELAGRNRMWRKMLINAVHADPDWKKGDYAAQPRTAATSIANFLALVGAAPIQAQKSAPTRAAADKLTDETVARVAAGFDVNDMLYAVSASRNYDPSAKLDTIKVPVMFINSADDFINPPELGIAEREIRRVPKGRFVLLPATEETYGHGTHTRAGVWKHYLWDLLERSKR
ncbi:MAG: alpha/beta fold hydrolase [Betaproteobacteria bacterium]|nr:alpha/beta fold hydrolase [Betaproteobacteria bacterium]